MAVITPAASRAFVTGARLPAPPSRKRKAAESPLHLETTDAQSLVVGSSLVVAASKVPARVREDLVDCSLFAQLAATAAAGDTGDVARWYEAYFGALTALGWAQSDTRFEDYAFAGRNAEAHGAILEVLTVLLGPEAAVLAVAKAAIEALQSMRENSPWITLLERHSRTGRSARFQVATAEVSSGGLLQTALVGFELKTKSTLTQVLFLKLASSSTSLRYAAGRATIYEAALAEQRAAIAARLAAYRAAYVGEVRLPPPPSAAARPVPPRRGSARRR